MIRCWLGFQLDNVPLKGRFRRGCQFCFLHTRCVGAGGPAHPCGGTELSALGNTVPQGNEPVEVSAVCRKTTPRPPRSQLPPESPIKVDQSVQSSPVENGALLPWTHPPKGSMPAGYERLVREDRNRRVRQRSATEPARIGRCYLLEGGARGFAPRSKLAQEFKCTGRFFSGRVE